jgi:hypothetical protein
MANNRLMFEFLSSFPGNEGASFVAVKTLKESAGDKERQELLKELQVMKTLKPHPNIVTLLGCCTDKGTKQPIALRQPTFSELLIEVRPVSGSVGWPNRVGRW